jgi:HEAT repeat protein
MPKNKMKQTSFSQVLAALLNDSQVFPAAYLHQFSDLDGVDLESLKTIWPQVNPTRRAALLEDLEDLAETDTLVLFDSLAALGLKDGDPRVRRTAIRLLWDSEDDDFAAIFSDMMVNDPDMRVRAAAASGLGKFIYLGELEEIPEGILHQVEENLIRTIGGQDDMEVRRRALEAIGYSGRSEVPELIRAAYHNGEQKWLVSALFAMGRSADDKWGPEVTPMLRHSQLEVQIEAVRAAGELALDAARRPMLLMLRDENIDPDLRDEIIWALSKVGGEAVRENLEQMLEETDDDEEAELLEDALNNLDFTEGMDLFDMLDVENMTDDQLKEFSPVDDSDNDSSIDEDEEESFFLDELEEQSSKQLDDDNVKDDENKFLPPEEEEETTTKKTSKKKPYQHH